MVGLAFRTAIVGVIGLGILPAAAQTPENPAGSAVKIEYVAPTNLAHHPIYERLKARRVLEDFRDFLSPVKLPDTLTVKVEGCNGRVNAWYGARSITICYEYIEWIHQIARKVAISDDISFEDAVVGPFVDVLLHEVAHALFDMLKIPVFGREEDAADQLAAFILLQFGKDVARRTITGAALLFRQMAVNQKPGTADFAAVHGLPAQRFVNVLCIAYGADRSLFGDFVQKGYLPQHRTGYCYWEYQQIAHAFKTLISPHIDPMLQAKVRGREWLPASK
jgi:Putative metallopeptidase